MVASNNSAPNKRDSSAADELRQAVAAALTAVEGVRKAARKAQRAAKRVRKAEKKIRKTGAEFDAIAKKARKKRAQHTSKQVQTAVRKKKLKKRIRNGH